METRDFLASIAVLCFILIILWYMVTQGWMPGEILQLIQPLIGLVALVLTAIYVVEKIRESV